MNFAEHYFKEVNATPRKGIQHIYGGDNGEYSMKPEDFLEIIKFLKDSKNKLNVANANISEKADGFSLKFGLNSEDEFFVESSRSGPIYDEGKFREFTISKKGESDPISDGYEDILIKLKNNKSLQSFLKNINTPSGIKIQTEAFYLPMGKVDGSDDSIVRFIATWYKKEKLGKWASFIVINATDGKGRPLHHEKVEEIKKGLKELSSDDIKFETGDVPDFKDIDLSNEIQKAETLIGQLETQYGKKVDDIILNPSRKRDAMEQKKQIKAEMLKLQKDFAGKLGHLIGKGKFGNEFEGIVVELSNGIMFKVVSDRFKDAKKAYNKEK